MLWICVPVEYYLLFSVSAILYSQFIINTHHVFILQINMKYLSNISIVNKCCTDVSRLTWWCVICYFTNTNTCGAKHLLTIFIWKIQVSQHAYLEGDWKLFHDDFFCQYHICAHEPKSFIFENICTPQKFGVIVL